MKGTYDMKRLLIICLVLLFSTGPAIALRPAYSYDYESMITKSASSSGVNIQGYWQAGSSFSLSITNESNRDFELYKAELKNDTAIIGATTDVSYLSEGLLEPSESTNVGFTLNRDIRDDGFAFVYYLTDILTGEDFEITHVYGESTYYRDYDGDGYGDPNTSYDATFQPSGYITNRTDCNDYDSSIHPGATEIRGDGIDQDCNGSDLASLNTYYRDYDNDGYGDPDSPYETQSQPSGYVTNNTDCNDYDSSIHPGATEIPEDGIDQDCNGSDLSSIDPDVEAFVTRFYQQCLSREPDTGGLEHWADSLNNGDKTGAELATSFVFSEEFENRNTSDSEFVTILYKAFFNRDPDTDGYNHWMDQIFNGTSRLDVLNGFTSAQEFNDLCEDYGITATFVSSDTSVEGFVTRFYQQCLSREPDTAGLNGWVNDLNSGAKAGGELAQAFVFSAEFQNLNTSDSEFVTILYNAFFNREPDTGGYNHWMNRMSNGTSRSAVLDGFTSAQEFKTLCEEYNISAN